MIDALFGSKTRIKLLHLFLNNPGKAFYVREITRLIGEQINSVRRELANMLEVGVITSRNTDNKLYYEVNQRYEFYLPFRAIFADQKVAVPKLEQTQDDTWQKEIKALPGIRVAIAAGVLVNGSTSDMDLLLVGDIPRKKLHSMISNLEKNQGREMTYSVLSYDEFYYRLSMRDKFITSIITSKHAVIIDRDGIVKE